MVPLTGPTTTVWWNTGVGAGVAGGDGEIVGGAGETDGVGVGAGGGGGTYSNAPASQATPTGRAVPA